jgi:hypothetical protein
MPFLCDDQTDELETEARQLEDGAADEGTDVSSWATKRDEGTFASMCVPPYVQRKRQYHSKVLSFFCEGARTHP